MLVLSCCPTKTPVRTSLLNEFNLVGVGSTLNLRTPQVCFEPTAGQVV